MPVGAAGRPAPEVIDADPGLLGAGGGPGKAPPQARPREPQPTEILGQVSWLMMHSPTHKHLFMADLEWLVLPPVLLRQFRVYRQKNVPVAYVSWAFLSDEVEKRLGNGNVRLAPGDWKSGDRPWLIDVVAPFGNADKILDHLAGSVFAETGVRTLVPDIEKGRMKTVILKKKQ